MSDRIPRFAASGDDEPDEPQVIIPPRKATAGMAFVAIAVVFFVGVAVGIVLGKTF